MLIRTVTANAEAAILSSIESTENVVVKSFLHCAFSKINKVPPDAAIIAFALKEILKDNKGILYYCKDNDVFIEWSGTVKNIIQNIESEIRKHSLQSRPDVKNEDFFHYYDVNVSGEELRILCKNKLNNVNHPKPDLAKAAQVTKEVPVKPLPKSPEFTDEQKIAFNNSIRTRLGRGTAEILIIEDQAFSRTLLLGILGNKYKCHQAKNGLEALALHAGLAPDIILLDVELPDMNGHEIAKFIRSVDKDVWIIMVTANNYQSDVQLAKENKVQGFIVKPYNKQKILEIMNNFNNHKNR